uniref:Uncharacterized protein n=1 Tax=Tetranychus urticae TaxID=32264 RepID=T1KIQ1_TETUR
MTYDDGQYGSNQYDDNQHSDNAKHEDKQYDDKYYEDKPAEGGLESPEQIGRRPGDSKDKGGKGGLLESYFWKALPGGDKKDSTYNYVIHNKKVP